MILNSLDFSPLLPHKFSLSSHIKLVFQQSHSLLTEESFELQKHEFLKNEINISSKIKIIRSKRNCILNFSVNAGVPQRSISRPTQFFVSKNEKKGKKKKLAVRHQSHEFLGALITTLGESYF